jgi:hypothetical protein
MLRHSLSPVVTKAVAASVVGCALLFLPARAKAQDPAAAAGALGQGFGAQGQFVIDGDASAHFDKVNRGGWIFEVRPAVDYFVIPNVTVGAVVGFGIDSEKNKGVLVGGRAGFNFNFTEHVGFWGRVGIRYNHVSHDVGGSTHETDLTVDLPILYHFVPHVFAGLAPYYNLNVAGPDSYGFSSLVGGWF